MKHYLTHQCIPCENIFSTHKYIISGKQGLCIILERIFHPPFQRMDHAPNHMMTPPPINNEIYEMKHYLTHQCIPCENIFSTHKYIISGKQGLCIILERIFHPPFQRMDHAPNHMMTPPPPN